MLFWLLGLLLWAVVPRAVKQVIVRDKDLTEEEVPTVLFPAQDAER